jgi:hypothetical protein
MDPHHKKSSENNLPTHYPNPLATDSIEAINAADYITKKLQESVDWNITSKAINKRIPLAVSNYTTGIIKLTTLEAL